MLASVALPESTKLFVSARCVNRMGLGTSSDNTNFTQLDTALPLAGELTSSRRCPFTPMLTRSYALTSYAQTHCYTPALFALVPGEIWLPDCGLAKDGLWHCALNANMLIAWSGFEGHGSGIRWYDVCTGTNSSACNPEGLILRSRIQQV